MKQTIYLISTIISDYLILYLMGYPQNPHATKSTPTKSTREKSTPTKAICMKITLNICFLNRFWLSLHIERVRGDYNKFSKCWLTLN